MKKKIVKFLVFVIITGFSFAEEGVQQEVNKKFSFIKDIYSDSWALIVGINNYQNVNPLQYAVNDAIAVNEMLVEKYGFKEDNIVILTDEEATKDNILKGFNNILQKAAERDRVVVFFAGHGETYKLPSGGDMGYLIPVDGNTDNLFLSSIPMKMVYDIAEMSYAKHILYLVDACYGGLAMNTRGLGKDQTPDYLKRMTRERGRQVITAGGKGEQVIEKPEWGHSAFTRNLIKGLGDGLADENSDGIITGDELGGFIKNRVVIDSDGLHTPQRGRIGSEMGEFVFISETLDEQFMADSAPLTNPDLEILQEEMAQLKELLMSSPVEYKPKPIDPKTAAALSWVFPGMGHFYSGEKGKGLMWTGLEIAALSGLAISLKNYSDSVDDYNFKFNLANEFSKDDGIANEYPLLKNDSDVAYDVMVSEQYKLIGAGTLSAVIWFWNTRDIKKGFKKKYSHIENVKVGINKYGQVETRISF